MPDETVPLSELCFSENCECYNLSKTVNGHDMVISYNCFFDRMWFICDTCDFIDSATDAEMEDADSMIAAVQSFERLHAGGLTTNNS